MPDRGARQAAAHWGDDRRAAFYAEGGLMWGQLAAVQARINAKISGDPSRDWIAHLMSTQLPGMWPVERALSLCCYEGQVERALARAGVFRHCLGLDISEGALRRARQYAAAEGHACIEYAQQDINALTLEPGQYDVVFSRGALHHIAALEHVLDQIAIGLKPHGILVINEYVGPSRFQSPDRRIEVCNAALTLLPERYRRSVSWQRIQRVGPGAHRALGAWLKLAWLKLRNGTLFEALSRRLYHRRLRARSEVYVKREVPRIQASEMAVDDPTEAIRSAEIVPLVRERFEILDQRPYGGTILLPVLDDIAGNFGPDDPTATKLLEMLFEIEDTLMAAGEIDSDFVYLVARPKR
ncbi:MAG: class I SAM-dependent methyltransferase [Armatimonadota bacterium]